MKSVILLSAIAGLLLQQAPAQADTIPAGVSSVFSARYPSVAAHWKADKTGYEAVFASRDGKSRAYFSAAGGWLRTETRIHWTKNLPPAVRQGFRQSPYVSWYVEGIKEMETSDSKEVTIDVSQVIDYQMGGLYKDVYRLYFSMDGKLMKTEKVS